MVNIVMTGGTSGFGAVAAQRFRLMPGANFLSGSRRAQASNDGEIALDLSKLESVRKFAQEVLARLNAGQIDVLVFNGGTQLVSADTMTVDGFEAAFATNHLSHYLLLRLLMPALAPGAHIVLTTSDTHDPEVVKVGPSEYKIDEWARGGGGDFGSGMRAYAASKFCNLMTARALSLTEDAKAKGFVIRAYTPGFTPDTGLFRGAPIFMRVMVLGARLLRPLLGLANKDLAGNALADLALGVVTPPAGHIYGALKRGQITWPAMSKLAQRNDIAQRLWNDSAPMVSLTA